MTDIHSHSRTAHELIILKNSHPAIRRLKRKHTASLHGNKFWGSALLIMDYLRDNPMAEGSKVLEVGCGWGINSLYCAKHFNADVVASDADPEVFPYLALHAEINQLEIETEQAYIEDISVDELAQFDYLLASDVCFWDDMVEPMFDLLLRAQAAGITKTIMSDPCRPPFRELGERVQQELNGEFIDWMAPHPHNKQGWLIVL